MTTDGRSPKSADGGSFEVNGMSQAGLIVEPQHDAEADRFDVEVEAKLRATEERVLGLAGRSVEASQREALEMAHDIVFNFKPVPWFIWRLANFVLGGAGESPAVSEGLIFGMRRLLFAAASDPLLGKGEKINNVRTALQIVSSDVIAAASVIHSICRRLTSRPLDRIWRPVLDEALIRARIGHCLARECKEFGAGRGMLAGFSSRSGLAVLLATGDLDKAQRVLEEIAVGEDACRAAGAVYGCDPMYISAMLLSAAGCNPEAASGIVPSSSEDSLALVTTDEQMRWLSVLVLCEAFRQGKADAVSVRYWDALKLGHPGKRQILMDEVRKIARRGHGWNWMT